MKVEALPTLEHAKKWLLAALCLVAGILPLAARWLPSEFLRIAYGLVVASGFLISTLVSVRIEKLKQFKLLSLAFLVFSLVQLLNNSVPAYVRQHLLHENSIGGNPLGSTVIGTVSIQLLETGIAIIPIFISVIASGEGLGAIYAQRGRLGRWLIFSLVAFFSFYLLTLRATSRHLFPVHGDVTIARYLDLTPPLLLMVVTNGFQEEFLFRGLFLRKYTSLFGPNFANLLQAVLFTVAHAGVTYTPNALGFLFLFVFPIGLFTGYLMRKTDSVLAPALFHAGVDIPIYLSFLTFVT